jgi:hypothetical protein
MGNRRVPDLIGRSEFALPGKGWEAASSSSSSGARRATVMFLLNYRLITWHSRWADRLSRQSL